MTVLVNLALATICFGQPQHCYPILYGDKTPRGEYHLNLRLTLSNGYGGDVLQFTESDKVVLAIHRLWMLNPSQHREERIKSNNLQERKITNGCINVLPEVYEKLKDCCSNQTVIIQ